jgi:hypothetical protein
MTYTKFSNGVVEISGMLPFQEPNDSTNSGEVELRQIRNRLRKIGMSKSAVEMAVRFIVKIQEVEGQPVRTMLVRLEKTDLPKSQTTSGVNEWIGRRTHFENVENFNGLHEVFQHIVTIKRFNGLIFQIFPNNVGVCALYSKSRDGIVTASGPWQVHAMDDIPQSTKKMNKAIFDDVVDAMDKMEKDESFLERAAELIGAAENIDGVVKTMLVPFEEGNLPESRTKDGMAKWIKANGRGEGQIFSSTAEMFMHLMTLEEFDGITWQELSTGVELMGLYTKSASCEVVTHGPWRIEIK